MATENNQSQVPATAPVVNPGPSQDVWADALKNAGINPDDIAEYNVADADDKK